MSVQKDEYLYIAVRGPCPMLNSLANHGFLPHTGKGIKLNDTIHALGVALNIDQDVATFLFGFAATTNPEPNATEFSLENLGRHNVLEHDASLTCVFLSTLLEITAIGKQTLERPNPTTPLQLSLSVRFLCKR